MSDPAPVPGFNQAEAELTRRIGIFDAHNDFARGIAKRRADGIHDSLRTYWLPRFRAGGIRVVVSPVWIASVYVPDGALRHAMQVVDALYQEIEDNADEIELAQSFADISRIFAAGKIAAVLALEGTEPLGHDLSALRLFHRIGVRMMSLTWMRRTAFAMAAGRTTPAVGSPALDTRQSKR